MAKVNLPKDWILVTSTTDPGRNYYFNTATNKSTWVFPDDDSDSQPTQNTRKNSTRKRKKNEEHDYRPHTPEGDPEVNRRPKLVAKRQLSTSEDPGKKKTAKQNADTPQMKALREKMLQRQAKTSAIKKPRPLKSSTLKASPSKDVDKVDKVDKAKVEKTPEKTPEKPRKNFKFDDEEEKSKDEEKVMTPAMKQMKQKMLARKSLSAVADRKKGKSSPKSQSARLSLARTDKSTSDDTVSSSTASTSTSTAQTEVQGLGSPRTRASRSLSCSTTPRRKSVKVAIESKLKQMKTLEAPPGVSAKRILIPDAEKVEDDDLQSNVSNAKIPRIGKLKAAESPEVDAKDPPVVFKNAEDRMKAFCSNLKRQRSLSSSFNDSGCSATKDSGDVFCEEMDWEPSEEEKIVSEIQNVRAQLVIEDDVQMQELNNTGLDLTDGGSGSNGSLRKLYIVVDTNVFLSNMKAVEEARDAIFKFYNRPIIVIPWTVIRELDFIKDDKSHSRPQSLKYKARHAIQFINKHFAAKHPRILGQTFADVLSNRQKFETECPDDEILQTCLQVQSAGHHVVLLSYDKNLCNKAMIHDVISLGKNDPLEKVDYLKESEIKKRFNLADSLKDVEQEETKAELLLAEELFEDLKTTLTSFMSVVVAKEMKNLYGETWERHTIIRPPWTVLTVLKCANKHWIAAVSDSFERRAESILKDLVQIVTGLQYSCQLKDVETMIQRFHDLVGCLKAVKYPNILENVTEAIEGLKQKFRDSLKLIYRNKGDNKQEEESKAALAFGYFETVYLFARDVCGTSASLMGMPFGLAFKKLESLSIEDDIKQLRPEVAGNLNRLMQILSTALDDIDHLHVDHPSVLALHQVLTGFLPELLKSDHQLMPQDVFLCLKYKQEVLKNGLGQLQDLSGYFCRMATFKCL